MILTVTLNLAIDVTYRVDTIRLGETTRVGGMWRRAGGKGVNVARVLDALGHEVVVAGLAGGPTGDEIRAELAAARLPDATMTIDGRSRMTLIVLDDEGHATGLSEPGPSVGEPEWTRWLAHFASLVDNADGVVLSGSLPPGTPLDAYAQMVTIARRRGRPVLLDAAGQALARGIGSAPDVVKVNAAELAGIGQAGDPLRAAEQARAGGPEAVVITLGAEGLLAVTPDGRWRCRAPGAVDGNATGAGDAAAAAIVAGMVSGAPWPDRLSDAVALSAAAVAAPLAGSYDAGLYERLRGAVGLEPVDTP